MRTQMEFWVFDPSISGDRDWVFSSDELGRFTAPVKDEEFLEAFSSRKIRFGCGVKMTGILERDDEDGQVVAVVKVLAVKSGTLGRVLYGEGQ